MTTLRTIDGKPLLKGSKLATSDDCCCECYDDEDCPSGYSCEDGECIQNECVTSEDCPEGQCCYEGDCYGVPCPTPYSISAGWCTLTPTQYPFADLNVYGGGSCGSTKYWMILNGAAPTEIQEHGGSYSYPVPGISAPGPGICRYVWVALVGFGPATEPTQQPTRCQAKAYYLYLDVERCSPTGGSAQVVEDTGHDWGDWPSGCDEGCEDDLSGCMSGQPFLTLSFAP